MGVDDALELLGPGFTNQGVRAFAVKRLERADDEVRERRSIPTVPLRSGTVVVPTAIGTSAEVRPRLRDR